MKAVELDNLTVKFGDFEAVKNLTLSVEEGEIFGFLGANGAGKTTAIRVMCGLLVPTSGSVCVAGEDFSLGGGAIKRKVGYMSQKFTLYDDLTVRENMEFKAAIRKLPDAAARERMDRIFEFIGYDFGRDTMVKDLPAGVKQQVSLAATLLHDPEIVFLDEPTSGVSPAVRARFWSLIRKLAGDGKTVFVTTHYMDEAEECGRIALMRAGKLIALGSPEQLEKDAYPRGLPGGKRATLEDVFLKLVEGDER
jgi:ABC-2 type transport system ATP-binding protein